jgi:hypothetical protein
MSIHFNTASYGEKIFLLVQMTRPNFSLPLSETRKRNSNQSGSTQAAFAEQTLGPQCWDDQKNSNLGCPMIHSRVEKSPEMESSMRKMTNIICPVLAGPKTNADAFVGCKHTPCTYDSLSIMSYNILQPSL